MQDKEYDFEFLNVEKQYESYNGVNVRLRYALKVLRHSVSWLHFSHFKIGIVVSHTTMLSSILISHVDDSEPG